MNAITAISARKSVRSYREQLVEDSKITAMVKAAGNAPQAGSFHLSVILNKDLLQKIDGDTHERMLNSGSAFMVDRASLPGYRPMYGAPLMLVFSGPEANPYSLSNVSNAATCAIIAATALGLGTCFIVTPTLALNTDKSLAKTVGLPTGYKALCCVIAGYAGDDRFATEKQAPVDVNYCR